MTEKTHSELYAELQEHVNAVEKALIVAQKFADEHSLSFSLELAYGMGGTYYPKGDMVIHQWSAEPYPNHEHGWVSSSSQC